MTLEALLAELDASDAIDGKSPWEFCCEWYRVPEIANAIERRTSNSLMLDPIEKIPTDIRLAEFAEWMTHQYRLAMNKGMQLANSARNSQLRTLLDLLTWVQHKPGCDFLGWKLFKDGWEPTPIGPCTCGLDAALKAAGVE